MDFNVQGKQAGISQQNLSGLEPRIRQDKSQVLPADGGQSHGSNGTKFMSNHVIKYKESGRESNERQTKNLNSRVSPRSAKMRDESYIAIGNNIVHLEVAEAKNQDIEATELILSPGAAVGSQQYSRALQKAALVNETQVAIHHKQMPKRRLISGHYSKQL